MDHEKYDEWVSDLQDTVGVFYAAATGGQDVARATIMASIFYPADMLVNAAITGRELGLSSEQIVGVLAMLQGAAVQRQAGVFSQIFSSKVRRQIDIHRQMINHTQHYVTQIPQEKLDKFVEKLIDRLS